MNHKDNNSILYDAFSENSKLDSTGNKSCWVYKTRYLLKHLGFDVNPPHTCRISQHKKIM